MTQTSTYFRQVPYRAVISQTVIDRFPGGIRVWDTPRSAVSGACVRYTLVAPIQVEVVAEQCEPFSQTPERVNICYDGGEGWVLAMMLTPVT